MQKGVSLESDPMGGHTMSNLTLEKLSSGTEPSFVQYEMVSLKTTTPHHCQSLVLNHGDLLVYLKSDFFFRFEQAKCLWQNFIDLRTGQVSWQRLNKVNVLYFQCLTLSYYATSYTYLAHVSINLLPLSLLFQIFQ